MDYLAEGRDGAVLIRVYAQPKASRTRIAGLHGEAVKVAVTSPPVDGKANAAILTYLAELFGVAKRDVVLVTGQSSRQKTFQIAGKSMEDLRGCLRPYLRD